MNTPNTFVNSKANQLAFYIRAYLSHQIPYTEIDLYLWDTLEEWAQVRITKEEPYTTKERVFWYLLHQVSFWSENMLENNQYIRKELTCCVNFLEGVGRYPSYCIGIRP